MDIFSLLVGFLTGSATGATGSYFATKYTEKRQLKEAKHSLLKKLKNLEKQMPQFFSEVREDYKNPENALKRDFYILSKGTTLNVKGRYLVYYHDDHPDLEDILALLESERFVFDITETNAPKYQFSNEFIDFVKTEK